MHNHIAFMNSDTGTRLETHEDIDKELRGYFKNLLQEPDGNREHAIFSITQHIPKIITEDHNAMLLQPVTLQEVEKSIT